MENKKKLIVIAVVFALVIGGAYALYSQLGPRFAQDQLATPGIQSQNPQSTQSTQEPTNTTAEPETVPAPDFTVYDAQGNEVRLSDYFGKPIVLNFWASWCGPCQMEMPDFQEKYLELGNDVQFLMINMTDGDRETVESAGAFIAKKGYTFPVFFDSKLNAANTYGAYSLPMTVLIDAKGNIITYAIGAISGETLQRGIDMIA